MDNNIEIWKDIKGYEGLYQVSNFGRVKSLERTVNNYPRGTRRLPEKIRLGVVNKSLGYRMLALAKDGKPKSFFVHRLVADAFLENPDSLPMVNHKDEDKTNNNVNNLEWCTAKYNMSYSNVFGSAKNKNSKPVCQYDYDGNLIKEYASSHDAAEAMGVESYCISYCCQGKIGSVKGFLWKYADVNYVKSKVTGVRSRRIEQKDMTGKVLKIWDSITEAADATGSNRSLIGRCCHGFRKSTNGYQWAFHDKSPFLF